MKDRLSAQFDLSRSMYNIGNLNQWWVEPEASLRTVQLENWEHYMLNFWIFQQRIPRISTTAAQMISDGFNGQNQLLRS
jgi:hypothetical protein